MLDLSEFKRFGSALDSCILLEATSRSRAHDGQHASVHEDPVHAVGPHEEPVREPHRFRDVPR